MFCPNCGAQNADDTSFCSQCGAALKSAGADTAQQNNTVTQVENRQDFNTTPTYAQDTHTFMPPVVAAVKKLGCSPLFLTAVVCYTVSVLFSLISAFMPNALFGIFTDLVDKAGIPAEILRSVNGFSAVVTFISMIPAILTVIAMWLSYSTCADKSLSPVKTAGLTIIKVLNMISLVLFCISAVMVVILFLMAIGSVGVVSGTDDSSRYYYAGVSVGLFVGFVIAAVVYTLVILYYVKLNKTINNIKETVLYGRIENVSVYVAVMTILSGIVTFFSAFVVLFNGNFVMSLSGIASSVSSICFAVFMFRYNSTVNRYVAQNNFQTSLQNQL